MRVKFAMSWYSPWLKNLKWIDNWYSGHFYNCLRRKRTPASGWTWRHEGPMFTTNSVSRCRQMYVTLLPHLCARTPRSLRHIKHWNFLFSMLSSYMPSSWSRCPYHRPISLSRRHKNSSKTATMAPPSGLPKMEYRFLGRSGLKVSAISLGGWLTYGGHVDNGKSNCYF